MPFYCQLTHCHQVPYASVVLVRFATANAQVQNRRQGINYGIAVLSSLGYKIPLPTKIRGDFLASKRRKLIFVFVF